MYMCTKAHTHTHPPETHFMTNWNSSSFIFRILRKYIQTIWVYSWLTIANGTLHERSLGQVPWARGYRYVEHQETKSLFSQGQLHWHLRKIALKSLDSWNRVKDYQKCCMPSSCLRQMTWLTSLPKLTILMLQISVRGTSSNSP